MWLKEDAGIVETGEDHFPKSREGEIRYRTLVEKANDYIAVVQNERTIYRNPAYEKFIGYSVEETSERSFLDLVVPEDRDRVRDHHYRRLMGEPVAEKYEVHIQSKDGRRLCMEVKPCLIQYNEQPATLVIMRDISERVSTEKALRESEERYRRMVEAVTSYTYSVHIDDGRIVSTQHSRACLAVTGYSAEHYDADSNLWHSMIYPEDRSMAQDALVGFLSGQDASPLEHRIVRRDGTVIWIRNTLVPFHDGCGRLIRYDGLIQDITERKLAYEELRKEKDIARMLLDSIPHPALLVSRSRKIKALNRVAREMGAKEGDRCWYGMFRLETIPPEQRSRFSTCATPFPETKCRFCRADEAFRTGEAVSAEVSAIGKIWVVWWVPIDSDTYLHYGLDITERRQFENGLRQAQKLEAIGTLAGGIAHDFNNILAPIMGYTEMMLSDLPKDNPMVDDLEQVYNATHRAKELVRQILAFSRMQVEGARQPVNIGEVLREGLGLIRATLPSTIEIHQDISCENAIGLANAAQIHQVLINLCTNAAHAMEEKGGVLHVSLTSIKTDTPIRTVVSELSPGSYLKLTVSDTGHGMDPETLERIFDPYFTTKQVGKGSGLGLTVVHGIVRQHEGGILVHSTPGKGTSFQVFLPGIAAVPLVVSESVKAVPQGRGRILFVDDEKAIVDMGKRMLQQLGYEVVATASNTEALDLFCRKPDHYDLVITDYTMPAMTGMDLAGEILRIRPGTPIILCTGYNEMISEEKARQIGVRRLLMKPITMREMAEAIRMVLLPT